MELRTPATVLDRVIRALVTTPGAPLDRVDLAHPGYIAIAHDSGTRYATGTANDTWTIDRLTAEGDTIRSCDTGVPTSETDAPLIAAAILATIEEDQEA